MKNMLIVSLVALLGFAAQPARANPDVVSREYKLVLNTAQFTFQTEALKVASLIQASKTAIGAAIARSVTGTAALSHQRDVRFFDTLSTCKLRKLGYSFRERVENGKSEVTLKYRSPDRYISDFEDVSSSTSGSDTKLEADIGANSTDAFKVVYAHSTTVPNTRTINDMQDINTYFSGFKNSYGFSDSIGITTVGGLTVRERVYQGVMIDLGSIDAEISVTFWYKGVPTGSQQPVNAEISFKYADPSADYTRDVVNRAKGAFDALRGLTSWVDPNSITKTAFVYDLNPSFCQ